MRYRDLGMTGLKVSAIGFGGIKLPKVGEQEAIDTLNRALDLGINFIDTARDYGDSERKIGVVLTKRRDECYIATKVEARDINGAMEEFETSLRELGVNRTDLHQLHRVNSPGDFENVTSPGGALEALKIARDRGKTSHIGISIHRDLEVMKMAVESEEFETIMVAYSPLDQEKVEDDVLPMAREHGIGVIAMKPLSGGQLVSHPFDGEMEDLGYDPVVRGSLRYILSNNAVSLAIPGMTCRREVEENAMTGDMYAMTVGEERELFKLIGKLGRTYRYGQFCLRCEYCQPCPEGIRIPEIFRAFDVYTGYPEPLRARGIEIYSNLEIKPDSCVECRECMSVCPAGISIPEKLVEIAAVLEA